MASFLLLFLFACLYCIAFNLFTLYSPQDNFQKLDIDIFLSFLTIANNNIKQPQFELQLLRCHKDTNVAYFPT